MKSEELRGRTALVTGASSGLGVDFADILAERGCHLVLVARREERLRELADRIATGHGVEVDVVAMDLSEPGAGHALYEAVRERGREIDVLVNNAGIGNWGYFVDIPWEREQQLLQLDIVTLVELTKLFARDMVARDRGWILQVASIGAFQPSPTYATYAAAKSFVLSFGEALSYELRHTNVRVSVLSPGVTKTEFIESAGQTPTLYQRLSMMQSRPVAEQGIDALLRGKPSKITGAANTLTAWSMRFVPRRLTTAMAHLVMKQGG